MADNSSEPEQDTPWTDDRVRWHEEFQAQKEGDQHDEEEGEEEEESAFIDPFKDPDPFDTFQFSFQVKSPEQHNEEEEDITASTTSIDIEIRGYKTGADQVWKSTGLTLWRAAEHLCRYMANNPQLFRGKRILELGAGLGLCGILAHKLGGSNVCITDGDSDALVHLRENVQRNKKGKDKDKDTTATTVWASQLIWGNDSTETFLKKQPQQHKKFDVLIASDIIYARCIVEPLWETVDLLLSSSADNPQAKFVMAYAKREVPVSIELVLEHAQEAGFSNQLVDEHPDGIWVYIFQRTK